MTKITKNKPLPPGSLGLPFIGESISFLRDPRDFTEKREKKYGPIFKTHILGSPTIVVIGAQANQFIFTNENKYFVPGLYKSTKILLGPASLLVQGGTLHSSRRKLLSQAFQPRALASYVPTMAGITASYLEKWQGMGTLTWYPELRNYTFDIASRLLIGTDGGSQTAIVKFQEWIEGLFTIPLSLPWTKFGKALRCRQELLEYIEQIIRRREQEENPGSDALGIILQGRDSEGNSLSLEEVKDQVLTLLFGGHETLTSAISSFCLLIGQYPEVLAKARQEQQQFPYSEPLTMEMLQQMTYLDLVLKEVLRVIPPVRGVVRKASADCELNGYLIPKGWSVQYKISRTHKDESVYVEPEGFDPDRFSAERAEDKQKRFGYLPFGGGLRECLGKEFAKLEMKIFAAMLLRGYEWELLPEQDLKLVNLPTPHPRDGLRVNFRKLS